MSLSSISQLNVQNEANRIRVFTARCDDLSIKGAVRYNSETINQLTSFITPVTGTKYTMIINTQSVAIGPNGSSNFSITNPLFSTTDVVSASINSYSGTYILNGLPSLTLQVGTGTCSVIMSNAHAVSAINGDFRIVVEIHPFDSY